MTRDITEGRSTRAIAVDLGIGTSTIWQNSGNSYDFAIAGIPFLAAINDQRPYERATAQFRKQQFDSQRDPGEQSLSNWWLRSQSSFHTGEGVLFYDPLANPYATTLASNSYRIKESRNCDIWTPGQVSLLYQSTQKHIATQQINATNGRVGQYMRSVRYNSDTNAILFLDGYDIDRIHEDGTVDHWHEAGVGQDKVYALTDDGQYAYWVTNDASTGKFELNRKDISAASTSSATPIIVKPGLVVGSAVIEYVKQRLVIAVNNFVYEVATTATTLPTTPVYTHPNTSYIFTSITESGPAIYVSGRLGIQSSIFKFTLDNTGAMPVLAAATTAAEMPIGEVIHKIFYYLGYMCIGTSRGVRVASIAADGSLTYGPIIFESVHGCYDFAARDNYVWCATGVGVDVNTGTDPGVIRIDLGTEIETLRFAYANDVNYVTSTENITTSCAFIGNTNKLAYATSALVKDGTITNKALTANVATLTTSGAHNITTGDIVWIEGVGTPFDSGSPYIGETVLSVPTTTTFTYSRTTSDVTSTTVTSTSALVKTVGDVYFEDDSVLAVNGYIQTGFIRYNTLEPKHFERLTARGTFTQGSMSLQTVGLDNTAYDIVSYDASIGSPEVRILQPTGAQDAIGLRFRLYRDDVVNTAGPTFKGYQLKALPATPRNRLITIPLMNFDSETDKYNMTIGYEGRAFERLAALEAAEATGDVVTWQDFRTNEIHQCLIEEVKFTDITPPDKKLTGFGGVILLTIRTV